ncbi:hypothetical protein JAAARDRAFT_52752 [Jaapia argillacea MUCL 33604]|uniref:IMD domain-containing protein n=1 Tax=Jaapia argillacea MUCL 33604 TaxID=933084 RepID=A0A067QQ88_9AGAM|nr:hypothetical protein JAAARDRAFT_52752 [Jaapia argillacea MUCL 33604]
MPRARSLRSLAVSTNAGRHTVPPGPPSPTFSEATNASAMNFGAEGPERIITRANLKASIQAYENLMSTCANYRAALVTMATATAAFADAMQSCASLKGPRYEAGTRFQAASGLHHLMSNHWHVLSETLDRKFEKPLRQHLDDYRSVVADRSASYEKVLREKSRFIRDTEMSNMHKKGRNLQSFREALTVLQRQVDELDELKGQHYQEVLEHEEEVWDVVQGKVSLVVRSTLDTFDRFTAKASDPVIEPMLQSVPDPFDSYGPPQAEDQIFSILAPLSILTTPSPAATPLTSTPELEHRDGGLTSSNITSWMNSGGGNAPGGFYQSEPSTPWADTISPGVSLPTSSTPPRSTSPPGSSSRRHSHPSIQTLPAHHSRKSESKLRSVLAMIDEGIPRTNGSDKTTPEVDQTPTPRSNGVHHEDSTWGAYTLVDPSSSTFSHSRENTLTPRNSVNFPSQTTPPPPDLSPERSRTPEVNAGVPVTS